MRFSAFLLVHRICIDATEAPDVVTRGNFDGVEEKAAAHRAEFECRIDVQDGQFTGRNSIRIHIQLEICTPCCHYDYDSAMTTNNRSRYERPDAIEEDDE
jgi:hypothetical protein